MGPWGRKEGADSSQLLGQTSRICCSSCGWGRKEEERRVGGLSRGSYDGGRERVSIARMQLERQLSHQKLHTKAKCRNHLGHLLISPGGHSVSQQTLAEYLPNPECNDSLQPSGETDMQLRTTLMKRSWLQWRTGEGGGSGERGHLGHLPWVP